MILEAETEAKSIPLRSLKVSQGMVNDVFKHGRHALWYGL